MFGWMFRNWSMSWISGGGSSRSCSESQRLASCSSPDVDRKVSTIPWRSLVDIGMVLSCCASVCSPLMVYFWLDSPNRTGEKAVEFFASAGCSICVISKLPFDTAPIPWEDDVFIVAETPDLRLSARASFKTSESMP